MKMASTLFVLFLLGTLLTDASAQVNPGRPRPRPPGQGQPLPPGHNQPMPLPPHTQPSSEIISERVNQVIRLGERVSLSHLLRLSPSEEQGLTVRAITLLASSLRGQVQVDVLSLGRPVSHIPQIIRRQLSEVRVILPNQARLSELEIIASDEMILDTITAEVESSWGPGPGQFEEQPIAGEAISLMVNRNLRGFQSIDLQELVRIQRRLTLEGAEIDRVLVRGQPGFRSSASVQVELNGRPVGPMKFLAEGRMGVPLPIKSPEEVRSLRLNVNGEAFISEIVVVVGRVRPIQWHNSRIVIMQEISAGRALELSRFSPNHNRLVSSIVLEATSHLRQAEVALIGPRGEVIASTIVTSSPMRPVLQLMRPMPLQGLRLQSLSPVRIESIELGFDSFQTW